MTKNLPPVVFVIFLLISLSQLTNAACGGDANAYTYMATCKCNPGYGGSIGSCTVLTSLSCGTCCTQPPFNWFQCVGGTCISIASQNDGVCDCTGCEDEACPLNSVHCDSAGCPDYTQVTATCVNQASIRDLNYCSYTSGFTCTDGSACIPWAWVRNGIASCTDGSDETTTLGPSMTYATCYNNLTISSSSYLTTQGLTTSYSCTCSYDRTGTTCLYANVIRLKMKVTKICEFTSVWDSFLSITSSTNFATMASIVYAGMTQVYKSKDPSNILSVCVVPYAMDPTIYVHVDISVATWSGKSANDIANVFTNYNSGQIGLYPITGALEDENECANSTLNECSKYASCTNTYGSYACTCNSGYDDFGWVFQSSISIFGKRMGRWCIANCNGQFTVGSSCFDLGWVIFLGLLLALLVLLVLLILFWLCCCRSRGHHTGGHRQNPNNQQNKQHKKKVNQSNHWAQTDPDKTGDHVITPLHSRPQSANNYYDHARSEPVAIRPVSPPPPGGIVYGSPKKTIMRSLTVQTDTEPDKSGKPPKHTEPQKHDTPSYDYNYVPHYAHNTRVAGNQTEVGGGSGTGKPNVARQQSRPGDDPAKKSTEDRHRRATHTDANPNGNDADRHGRGRSNDRHKSEPGDRTSRAHSTDRNGGNKNGNNSDSGHNDNRDKPKDEDYQKKKSNRGSKRPPPQWKHWKSVPRELNPVLSNENF